MEQISEEVAILSAIRRGEAPKPTPSRRSDRFMVPLRVRILEGLAFQGRFPVARNLAVGHLEPVKDLQLRLITLALALSLNLLGGPAASNAAAVPLGTNLLVNGDAEAGAGSLSGRDVLTVPGWTTANNFTVVSYGAPDFPTADSPGPAERGTNFFSGGPSTTGSSASQLIDVSAGAAEIDAGTLVAELTGYLGGFSGQGDNAVLTARFLSGTGEALGELVIGPVLAADRTNTTGLLFRGATNAVPAGTRQILVTLDTVRTSGSYNDGYADNLSLVLQTSTVGPALSIAPVGDQVAISWLTSAADFHLESTASLSPPVQWNVANDLMTVVGNSFVVTNYTHEPQRFYRLRQP